MFMAMAFYEGRTLSEKIGDAPLLLPEAIGVAIEVARGLAHAHEASVTHRDIKPSNIFLTERGGVKILDFGLAKQGLMTLTDPGTRLLRNPSNSVGPVKLASTWHGRISCSEILP